MLYQARLNCRYAILTRKLYRLPHRQKHMADIETISNLQKRLVIYRRNLQHLLAQAAQYGGETLVPLDVMNNIRDQRENIADTKASLRASGISVEDQPSETFIAEANHTFDPKDRRLAVRFKNVLDHISGQLAIFLVQHNFADAMRITLSDYDDVPNTDYPNPDLVAPLVSVFEHNSLKGMSNVLVNDRRLSWGEVLILAFAQATAECDRLLTQHAERNVVLLSLVDDIHDRSDMLAMMINTCINTPELSVAYDNGMPTSQLNWIRYYLLAIMKSYRVIRQLE